MLQINDLVYRIAGRTLFDGATVSLPEGTRAGLVGPNGSGKTTLFRLIRGETAPESGSIQLPRRARIGTVAQEAPEGPDSLISFVLSADAEREALLREAETATDGTRIGEIHARLTEIDAYAAEARAARILSGLGFDPTAQQRPLDAFSGGWRMRVALAAILFAEPDLLLLDEPTNYLDLEGTLWLENYLARYPHSMLIISHDRDLLNNAVDTIVHLDQRKLTAWRGGYDQFERQRREKQALQEKALKKQLEQRRHMQAFIDRFRYKASKARQAQSRLKALEKMEPVTALVDQTTQPFTLPSPERPLASPLIVLDDVSVGYGGPPVLSRVDLRLDHDDRIGLLGANGNGKSTLAKLLSDRMAPDEGRVITSERLRVGYFAQHQLDELHPDYSPCEQVRAILPEGTKEAVIRSRTAQLGFSADKADIPASSLSGGEKARLLLGLAAFKAPHLLILDEPTNHLDVDAREALVQALAEYQGAVILISHDRHLLEASVDRLWLVADGTVKTFEDDLDAYRRMVLKAEAAPANESATSATQAKESRADQRRAAAEKRAQLQPLRDRIKKNEKRIEELNKRITELDAKLADPDLFARAPDEGAKLAQERARAVEAVEAAEEDWLAAGAELEDASQEG